jgi:methylphosphotriester-DNA--protein-cysteine methyltransferase
VLADSETAHGLEQQVIHALVECFAKGAPAEAPPTTHKYQDVVSRFEALLQTELVRSLRVAEICAALAVSALTLRIACEEQLGMGPAKYVRRRHVQFVGRS